MGLRMYYGVIYFRDGRVVETGTFSDEISCERHTSQQFDQYMRIAISPAFEPTRYIVKEK